MGFIISISGVSLIESPLVVSTPNCATNRGDVIEAAVGALSSGATQNAFGQRLARSRGEQDGNSTPCQKSVRKSQCHPACRARRITGLPFAISSSSLRITRQKSRCDPVGPNWRIVPHGTMRERGIYSWSIARMARVVVPLTSNRHPILYIPRTCAAMDSTARSEKCSFLNITCGRTTHYGTYRISTRLRKHYADIAYMPLANIAKRISHDSRDFFGRDHVSLSRSGSAEGGNTVRPRPQVRCVDRDGRWSRCAHSTAWNTRARQSSVAAMWRGLPGCVETSAPRLARHW